jgi:Glutathione S-transferase, C-terminal domain
MSIFQLLQLSWADLYFVAIMDTNDVYSKTQLVTSKHPNLLKLVENVRAIPSIKAWLAKRPVTDI